ncbi:MAG: hypothetical protein US12_C0021G0002 [Parcubacteria group bacterium GW2011_GWA2_36_24]|nr:MAG: hypothetical protein US12_C0021G0002 [Parcubacteria group bacterium GW2011_GWA2_36_24]
MRKAYIFLVLGIWMAVLPYLGFPHSWKNVLITLSGFGLIYTSFTLYKESRIKETKKEETFDNFSENEFLKEEKREEI